MIQFEALIKKFAEQGEKTGWTYIEIPESIAQELLPGNKKEFKVKGCLGKHVIHQKSLMPLGGGSFIMALNAEIRKAIGKTKGAMLSVKLEVDPSPITLSPDLMQCLADEPSALDFFKSLTGSHQKYFSKWIESAKTEVTKAKRIAMAVSALSKKWGYPEMLRAAKK